MSNNHKNFHDNFQGHPQVKGGLIDFPCSDIWADHYYENDYSGYRPLKKKPNQSRERAGLERKVQNLETHSIFLDQAVKNLQTEISQLRKAQSVDAQNPTRRYQSTKPMSAGITEQDLVNVQSHG